MRKIPDRLLIENPLPSTGTNVPEGMSELGCYDPCACHCVAGDNDAAGAASIKDEMLLFS